MKEVGKSQFNLEVIALVKQMRESKGLSQDDIAEFLDLTRDYIGQVENPCHRAKYDIDHLNRLAFEMNCSLRDFLPIEPFSETINSGRRKHKK